MPNDEWERLLGRDVNNLEHMSLTHGIAVAFIRFSEQHQPDLLSEEEKESLLLTAVIHDWGEAIRGDVSYSDKTNEEESQEQRDFMTVVNSVGHASFTKEEILRAKEIAFDHEGSKLGKMFFAIEQLGYMRTAIKAARIVHDQPQPDGTTDGLTWLTADVLGNIMRQDKIIEASHEYDAVRAALEHYAADIDTAFQVVRLRPLTFENYGDNVYEKFDRFMSANEQWELYKAQREQAA
jgi:cytochrome c1